MLAAMLTIVRSASSVPAMPPKSRSCDDVRQALALVSKLPSSAGGIA